jgi:hypothetical protein
MKQILFYLATLLAVGQMTANYSDSYKTVKRATEDVRDSILIGTLAVATNASYWKVFCAWNAEMLPSGPLYAIGCAQLTTGLATVGFSNSTMKHISNLDRNLALNVIDAAF